MKIVLTGGGSAGHFYPLIAIAEAINNIAREENYLRTELYFMSTTPYDKKALFDNGIAFQRVFAGKSRIYFSLLNILDIFKLFFGILKALWDVYFIYPDVIISKGGYASLPAVFAARILRIPVIVHESDSVPGRANLWASRFAARVAISWPEAYEFFPKEKTALTGQPVRSGLITPEKHGAHEFLKLKKDLPVIFVLGGSQGAQIINEKLIEILSKLVADYQIIHQTGAKNFDEVTGLASIVLKDNPNKESYKPFPFLNTLAG